jgi:hypothetical protein
MDELTQDDKLKRQPTTSASLRLSVIANPAENHPLMTNYYAALDQLEEALQEYAQEAGFAVSQRRSKKFTSGPKKGELQKVDLYCDRGRLRIFIAKSRKSRTTKSADCEWTAVATCIASEKFQRRFRIKHSKHTNHGASITPSEYSQYRAFTEEMEEYTNDLSVENTGIQSREVGHLLRQRYPDATFLQRDVENLPARLKKQRQDGYSPVQAVIKLMDDEDIKYSIKFADDDKDRIVGLFWTLPWCEI